MAALIPSAKISAVEGNSLVKRCGNLCDEVRTRLILHILGWAVGQHLQRCLESDIHRHLVYTGTLTHRMVVVAKEIILHGVHHGSGGIVHRSCQHAEIRGCDIITGLVGQRTITHAGFPLGVLQTLDTLEIEDVRICPLYTEGLQTMIVEVEMVASGTGCLNRDNKNLIFILRKI